MTKPRTLAPETARKWLTEIVNVRVDDPAAEESCLKRYGSVIPPFQVANPQNLNQRDLKRMRLLTVVAGLRDVWEIQDDRSKEFAIFDLRRRIAGTRDPSQAWQQPLKVPPPTPFDEAIVYLQKNWHLALICQNPDCQALYFFANRRTQKYCSKDCAEFGQRAAKRKWWEKEGCERRRNRRRQGRAKR